MAQGKRRRGHRSSGAAAGLTGPASASSLHSVNSHRPSPGADTHPPTRHDSASIWSRRRVLLLNSTYEPLTALPMRRAIVMVICGKADVVHDDPAGPIIHSATKSIVVPSVIQLRSYVRVPYRARVPMTRAALMLSRVGGGSGAEVHWFEGKPALSADCLSPRPDGPQELP